MGVWVFVEGAMKLISFLRGLRQPQPTQARGADDLWRVLPPDDLFHQVRRPGDTEPEHVERPECAAFDPVEHHVIVISGLKETGKTFEALHCIRRIREECGVPELSILMPTARTLAPPDRLPAGCARNVILFIDDLQDFALPNVDLGRTLHDLLVFFRKNVLDHCDLVATVRKENLDTAPPSLRAWIAKCETVRDACHLGLQPLSGDTEFRVLQSLCAAFRRECDDAALQTLAGANDGTAVTAYDYLGRPQGNAPLDATGFSTSVHNHWRGTILPKLPEAQRRVVELMSVLRSCSVPLREWAILRVAHQTQSEANQMRLLGWRSEARRFKTAMEALARTWAPRTPEGAFAPHDSRLDLDRPSLVDDARLIARALVPLCADEDAPPGLIESYAGLAATLKGQGDYAALIPVLQAWRRWSHRGLGPRRSGADAPTAPTPAAAATPPEGTREWAHLAVAAGVAFWDLPTGSRAANLADAVACYEAALRVYTEAAFPIDWAMVQSNLGTAYAYLPAGDREANLKQAIACYEAALRVYTEAEFPSDWAAMQNNLGLVYAGLPTGDREVNLRQAVACYEAALRVYSEATFPVEWAMTQNNLGIAYANLLTGDREANLRQAIVCFEAALRVVTESAFPTRWATTQANLGSAYASLPTGDRDANLRQAIACHEAALRVFTEATFPKDWAMAQNNLGNDYADLLTGDRDANLRQAIACYEAALRVYTEAAFSVNWAMTQNNLGAAYARLPVGDRGANLRQAIACFEAALQIRTEATFPHKHAESTQNLQRALQDLGST